MKMPVRIDGTTSRAVTGAITTTIACVIPVFLVGGLAVQISDELHFDPAGLGLAVSAYFAISAIASVPSGALVERFGPTGTARVGIAIAAAGLIGIAVGAHSYAALLGLLAFSGFGNALGQLASNDTLASGVRPGRQGLSFGIKQAAIPASTLLAGLAVPAVALTAGWRWAFVIAAVLALGAIPLVPGNGRSRRRQPNQPRQRVSPGDALRLGVIALAAVLAAGSANALTFLVDAAVAGGMAPGTAGLALSAGGAVCLIARVLAGWLADRRGGGHLTLIALGVSVGAGGLALLAVPSGAALVVGVLLGFGLGWAWPGLLNFSVVQLHPRSPATATSITQTGVYAGACVGPLAFGAAAAGAGYPTAWLGAAVTMLLAAGLMLLGQYLLRKAQIPGS